MPTNILFLAETNLSPSLAEQRAQCEASGDVIVEAGQVSFLDLPRKLAQQGFELGSGDRIKIYDFTCLPVNTMTLVRLMVKLLGKGVAIEFCAPHITLQPGDGESVRLLAALDGHWRRVHGMKTHSSEGKPGRKALLHPDRLPEVRAMLAAEGATYAGVAAQLGVGRSTLYEFLDRQRAAGNA